MPLRQPALDLAVLGRLMHGPSYGYEVRKHVNMVVGYPHKVSFGSLYPALRRLLERGQICDCGTERPILGGRAKRIYHVTPSGEEYLMQQLVAVDSAALVDDFGVRFSLLGMTDIVTRLRILRGRRDYTASRLAVIDDWSMTGLDYYSQELVRYSRDAVADELAWLDRVIAAEESVFDKENK